MAHYVTTIASRLSPDEAFAYMADFSNARFWDPTVSKAERKGEVGAGAVFDLVARFGGREVALSYTTVTYEAPRLIVLEAVKSSFVSRDTITVEAAEGGSRVDYDAVLAFKGPGRLLDPLMQLVFSRVGKGATAGLQTALNP